MFTSEPRVPALVPPPLEQLKDKGESVDVVKFYNWNLKNKQLSSNMQRA